MRYDLKYAVMLDMHIRSDASTMYVQLLVFLGEVYLSSESGAIRNSIVPSSLPLLSLCVIA